MPARTSSTSFAILGILTFAPMSGYDVGQNFRASVGHMWSESYGQIYPTLKKLAAAGLVSAKTEKQSGKPDRRIYSITAKGRKELAAWLEVAPQPEIPRNEMLLKLFFGAQVPAFVLITYVERMVAEHRDLLAKFTRIEKEQIAELQHMPEARFWKMSARYGQLEMEAHVRWAEETLIELRKLDRKQKKKENHHGSH